jgi:hypothetical protein
MWCGYQITSLPDHIDRITLKYRIGSDQRKFFLDASCNQDAIEGIAMMHRQSCPLHDSLALRLRLRWKREGPLAEDQDGAVLGELQKSAKSV